MKEFMETQDALMNKFNTDISQGLTSEQASLNQAEYGKNTLTREKPESLVKRILGAASEPMILMLVMAGIIALVVNIIRGTTGGEADYLECVGIFTAISLSVIITVVMEGKSAKAFEALSKISDDTLIKVLRNGDTIMTSQKDIVVGDILLLSTGDRIPADGRLIESIGLNVDESALTGESIPAKKDANVIITDEKTPLAERSNMLYSGNFITSGYCKMMVTAVGDDTEFGKIASELTHTDDSTTPLQEKLARLGKTITILGIIAASIVFVTEVISFAMSGGLVLEEVLNAFVTSIVLIVAAVPEGLPTIVAVSLSINIIKLSRQNALVKKMIASETVGCINVICSDKTGTLTENKMTVANFYDDTWHEKASDLSSEWLIHNICLNTTADISKEGTFIGNPTECAMLNFYEASSICKKTGKSYKDERQDHDVVQAFPFSSELKHMTTISKVDGKIISYVKGSPECVIAMCDIADAKKKEVEDYINKAQEKAMRVIAFAHKELEAIRDYEDELHHAEMEKDMVFDGFVTISDPLRKDVYEAVKNCRIAGIDLKILTGDNIVTATAIASELHILEEGHIAVEAKDIIDLSDEDLLNILPKISVIARSTPTIKMRVVKLLKREGNVVAVTGDGINDAPALKNADVGIAMGISGTEVSKEASDIVLLDDSFSTIVKAIVWGRGIYENFKRFIQFQLTVNIASVIVVFTSIILGFKAPFTALQLLWINIIMDGPPALTLGLEPIYDDLMSRPPTKRSDNIVSKGMLVRIGVTGLFISVVFLCQYSFNYLGATKEQVPTVLFTLFTLFQLFNAFNCRELHSVSIFKHLFKNKIMLLVISITFLLQILIIQFAGAFFGTIPLDLSMWLKIFGVTFSVVILSELVKLVYRRIKE
ncbi:calcium-translocating P-type ATPase, PMCA-type [Anaeromicropila herbilytica]|uniref:P-type Ca(2+) transporter n=1 Tax=Anaeromicropila herbilytica TaxID=2785025 RepID=A0A7R7IEP5_9FIRM|nr:calcium-translocating P-type ATPase, PMCA-type [Anaeromicropila herbilytica]BCN32329.1 calcium-translocating P-type ATPase, PMCA-type [Anaeromicropila herbilytica]